MEKGIDDIYIQQQLMISIYNYRKQEVSDADSRAVQQFKFTATCNRDARAYYLNRKKEPV